MQESYVIGMLPAPMWKAANFTTFRFHSQESSLGAFLEHEKPRQAIFKATSSYFSDAARADGIYKEKAYPFCLPRECAEENLFPDIRNSITRYFAAKEIKWHDGQDRRPSNHLCDSQVCCSNFLFPFADIPDALAELLRQVFPTIKQVLAMETDGQVVSFEWIGEKNYLGEIISVLPLDTVENSVRAFDSLQKAS